MNYSWYFKNMRAQEKLMKECGAEYFAVSHRHTLLVLYNRTFTWGQIIKLNTNCTAVVKKRYCVGAI